MLTRDQVKEIKRGAKQWDIELKTGSKIMLKLAVTECWEVGVNITIDGETIQYNCKATDQDKKLWQTVSDIATEMHMDEINKPDPKRTVALGIYNNIIN